MDTVSKKNKVSKKIQHLRKIFKKYSIDGYVVPKNDDYFTEYSKINRLKIISNFSGSAGIAIILKNKNYLFTDGRYSIQSQLESGKNFNIVNIEKIFNCNLFKNLRLGLDPKLFTYKQIKNFFLKNNKVKFINKNLIDEIKRNKITKSLPFFSLKKNIVGESAKEPYLSMGAEDFSYFANQVPGCFFFVGSAPLDREPLSVPHHCSHFDIDERALLVGSSIFVELVEDLLIKSVINE